MNCNSAVLMPVIANACTPWACFNYTLPQQYCFASVYTERSKDQSRSTDTKKMSTRSYGHKNLPMPPPESTPPSCGPNGYNRYVQHIRVRWRHWHFLKMLLKNLLNMKLQPGAVCLVYHKTWKWVTLHGPLWAILLACLLLDDHCCICSVQLAVFMCFSSRNVNMKTYQLQLLKILIFTIVALSCKLKLS